MKDEVVYLFRKQLQHQIDMNRSMPKEYRANYDQLVGYAEQVIKDVFFEYLDEVVKDTRDIGSVICPKS